MLFRGLLIRILLANPRGFCAGVHRAISIVERAMDIYSTPIYVFHEIVHNDYIVANFNKNGVIFVKKIHEVPDGAVLIFSAHGVSKTVRDEAKHRDLIIFDATCPLVAKVHMEVVRASRNGVETILIGHAGHPEVHGTIGQYNNSFGGIYLVESIEDVWLLEVKSVNNLCFVTQTTLSVNDTKGIIAALRDRFPLIIGPRKDDICYATFNRQQAVCNLINKVDKVIVVGSKHSSNSNRLAELVKSFGKLSYLIDNVDDIQEHWIKGIEAIGITAGASAPNILISKVIDRLQELSTDKLEIEEMHGSKENITFEVPQELRAINTFHK